MSTRLVNRAGKSENPGAQTLLIGHASSFHDPAVCLIYGDRIFAESIERHMQCKRAMEGSYWYSKPALRKALRELQVPRSQIQPFEMACSWNTEKLPEWRSINAKDGALALQKSRNDLNLFHRQQLESIINRRTLFGAESAGPIFRLDHHMCHAANAALTSPFEECAVLVADGAGEARAFDFFSYQNGQISRLGPKDLVRQKALNSVRYSAGGVYSFFTSLCGFDPMEGEEWKLMGLAAYGSVESDLYNFLKSRISVHDWMIDFNFFSRHQLEHFYGLLRKICSSREAQRPKYADLACTFQTVFAESMRRLVANFSNNVDSRNLAFAGGCALNSSLNGQLIDTSRFTRLHVPFAPADDGNALGAALLLNLRTSRAKRKRGFFSPYLGSRISRIRVRRILETSGFEFQRWDSYRDLCRHVARQIAGGAVVGWAQGRAEFGPRALGNRSILANPALPGIRDRINSKVKGRELFRPLCPSILHEFGSDYFENYVESPYMERVFKIKPDMAARIPAVVHIDQTCRAQSVKKSWNPLFHCLLTEFYNETAIPVLLNTSFNVMGKPIIHSADDAFTVFITTDMDLLVIGRYVVSKRTREGLDQSPMKI